MIIEWQWLATHTDDLLALTLDHLATAVPAVLLGLLIALPLAVIAHRIRPLRGILLGISNIMFTVPSLALFVLLLPITGLTRTTAIAGLTVYTLVVLLRNTVEGLDSVPVKVREASLAMGISGLGTLVKVEFPLALPVIMAGVRVASVMTISLVSVASYIGYGGIGQLFTDGFQRSFPTPVLAGVVLTLVLALAADAVLVLVQWLCTPWTRKGAGA
ncbi:ABC transporter permease [Nonomuraea sp. NPDC049480]|uniref:ABC transporter permease n=1 Tax=Nonomuraea sp. NPDC049480 TaxID=3364353 RepID=UPI003790C2CD